MTMLSFFGGFDKPGEPCRQGRLGQSLEPFQATPFILNEISPDRANHHTLALVGRVRTSAASTLGGGMTVVTARQIAPNRRNARKGPRSSAGGMERPGDAPSRPEILS